MFNSNFIYDGFKSQDMNLYIVSMSSNTFVNIPVTNKTDNKTNMSFDVEIAYADTLGIPKKIDNIARRLVYSSLIKDDYKELILEDYPEVVFYAKFIPLDVNISAKEEGYFKFRIETNSSNAYTEYRDYEFENRTEEEQEIVFSSYDNFNMDMIYPIIELEVLDNTIEEIYVKTDGKEVIFDFRDLKDYETIEEGEKIFINCETHTIEQSSLNPDVNRIRHWNCSFLELGNLEYLRISPKTKMKIRYRLKVIV